MAVLVAFFLYNAETERVVSTDQIVTTTSTTENVQMQTDEDYFAYLYIYDDTEITEEDDLNFGTSIEEYML